MFNHLKVDVPFDPGTGKVKSRRRYPRDGTASPNLLERNRLGNDVSPISQIHLNCNGCIKSDIGNTRFVRIVDPLPCALQGKRHLEDVVAPSARMAKVSLPLSFPSLTGKTAIDVFSPLPTGIITSISFPSVIVTL